MLLVGVSQHTPGEEWAWYLKEPAEKKFETIETSANMIFLGGKGIHIRRYHSERESFDRLVKPCDYYIVFISVSRFDGIKVYQVPGFHHVKTNASFKCTIRLSGC